METEGVWKRISLYIKSIKISNYSKEKAYNIKNQTKCYSK